MSQQETRLEMAKRHVTEGRRIVADQKRLIEQQKEDGFDVSGSEDLLRVFQRSLSIFEHDLEVIMTRIR